MKFSALVGEGLRIVHVKFQLSVTLGAAEIRLERKLGLFLRTGGSRNLLWQLLAFALFAKGGIDRRIF